MSKFKVKLRSCVSYTCLTCTKFIVLITLFIQKLKSMFKKFILRIKYSSVFTNKLNAIFNEFSYSTAGAFVFFFYCYFFVDHYMSIFVQIEARLQLYFYFFKECFFYPTLKSIWEDFIYINNALNDATQILFCYLSLLFNFSYRLFMLYIIEPASRLQCTKNFLFFLNNEHLYYLNNNKYDNFFNYYNYIKGYILNQDCLKINLLDYINQADKLNNTFEQTVYNQKIFTKSTLNLNVYTKYSPNFSFLSKTSLNITILSVWQYWWWLYFVGIAILFNKVIFKLFFDTNLYVNPKIHNSLKSNGRWGDIIASAFPVFWCSNILLNSNLILRLTENHSESGWMTLRVRGKQWYWVYKLPINLKQDFEKLPIILGRGNKLTLNKKNNLLYINHKKIFLKKQKLLFNTNYNILLDTAIKKKILFKKLNWSQNYNLTKKQINFIFFKENFNTNLLTKKTKANKLYYKFNKNNLILTKNNLFNEQTPFLNIQLNSTNWFKKYYRHFFTIQQQPKTNWLLKNKVKLKQSNSNFKTKFFEINTLKKKNFLNKQRLISSYNTLLLPTNVNITVITNSFDVVHSWFIPGLGIKFDCVPGRSTHYTLRINKPGIYLGHCAEICGRFHHHMPIKIVALPLNQFLYYYDCYYPEN